MAQLRQALKTSAVGGTAHGNKGQCVNLDDRHGNFTCVSEPAGAAPCPRRTAAPVPSHRLSRGHQEGALPAGPGLDRVGQAQRPALKSESLVVSGKAASPR